MSDRERNRFSARAARYARVGANVGGVAARIAATRLMGGTHDRARGAMELAAALGGLKGPIMKVAQLMATIPDALPPEYAEELAKLQSDAPPMGWAFVKRRMMAELGADWQSRFASFEHHPAAAASLGQVHRATAHDGAALACKLQYPDMQSAVEADLKQLEWLFAIHRRMEPAIDTTEMAGEIGARIREELDYEREAKHVALYRTILADTPRGAGAAGVAGTLDPPPAHPRLARGQQAARPQGRRARRPQPPGGRHVQGVVAAVQPLRRDPRRSASRQLHRVPGRRRPARHQPARLRLHPHLPAEIRRRRGRPLSRPARRRPRSRRPCLRDLGFQAPVAGAGGHPQHLGAFHLSGRCSTTASAPSPTA